MQLKKIAGKLGFTHTEFIVITSLAGIFFIGLLVKYYQVSPASKNHNNFDYTSSDSLFFASDSFELADIAEVKKTKTAVNKQDVLELNRSEISRSRKVLPAEKSIDLNTAGINELSSLPGIGEKTAVKILELRKEKGSFRSIEELEEVSGIGPSKMQKIGKYIFVR
ncbi:MAG: ComEA family DNA-binding protein [Ignavibacteriales bacterium]